MQGYSESFFSTAWAADQQRRESINTRSADPIKTLFAYNKSFPQKQSKPATNQYSLENSLNPDKSCVQRKAEEGPATPFWVRRLVWVISFGKEHGKHK